MQHARDLNGGFRKTVKDKIPAESLGPAIAKIEVFMPLEKQPPAGSWHSFNQRKRRVIGVVKPHATTLIDRLEVIRYLRNVDPCTRQHNERSIHSAVPGGSLAKNCALCSL